MTVTTVRQHSRIDLPSDIRKQVLPWLNSTLATALDLYSQVKQAHWNVKGPYFISLHQLFDQLAELLEDDMDDLAERIPALGGLAYGTVRLAAQASVLSELPHDLTDGHRLLEALADRYAAYARLVREHSDQASDAGDATTADLLTQLSRTADKSLWMLESHLI